MRKHIGNTTIYRSKKIEADPAREKKRLELSRQWQIENTKMQVKKYLQTISGQSDIMEVILYLFGEDGQAPKNISIKTMVQQYELLTSRKRWVVVITKQLVNKLKELDAERYAEYEADKEVRLKKMQDIRDKIFKKHSQANEKKLKNPAVIEAIRFALKKNSEAKYLKSMLTVDTQKMDILGFRRIEKVMLDLFAEYIKNPIYDTSMDPKIRFDKLIEDVQWFEAMIAEVDKALVDMNEFIESAYEYMKLPNDPVTKNGGWKLFRKKQNSDKVFI